MLLILAHVSQPSDGVCRICSRNRINLNRHQGFLLAKMGHGYTPWPASFPLLRRLIHTLTPARQILLAGQIELSSQRVRSMVCGWLVPPVLVAISPPTPT